MPGLLTSKTDERGKAVADDIYWCHPCYNGGYRAGITTISTTTRTITMIKWRLRGCWWSPTIAGLLGPMVVVGVSAIAQKIAEADEWARKYRELDQQLTEARSQAAAKGDDKTLIKAAQDLLHKGKLEEVGNIYDQLLARGRAQCRSRGARSFRTRPDLRAAISPARCSASLRDGLSISTGSRRICARVRPDIGTPETV